MSFPIGTLDLAKIQDALYDWVYSVTKGVLEPDQIIWRDQTEQIPPRPFVSLKITSGPSPTDRDASVFLSSGRGVNNVGIQMEATLSVQVFGNTKNRLPIAYQLAVDINSSLLGAVTKLALGQGGVSIQGLGKVQNLSALEESKYEERAGFDLELGMVQNISDQPGVIEQVNIEQTIGSGPTTVIPVTIP